MNNSILLIELFLNCKHYCDLHALLVVEVSCRYRVVLRGHSGVVSLSCRRNQNFFASTLWPLSTTLRRQRHDTMIPLWPPSTITTRQRQLDDNSTTPLWPQCHSKTSKITLQPFLFTFRPVAYFIFLVVFSINIFGYLMLQFRINKNS